MKIVLLRGFSFAGKDSVGKILVEKYGFRRVAFADSLKKIVSKEHRIPIAWLHDQEKKREKAPDGRTWRKILLDTAIIYRATNPDIFAEHCCQEIREECDASLKQHIVITDWRYPNELATVIRLFPEATFYTVWVKRAQQTVSPVNDDSEYLLIDRSDDIVIDNSGSLEDLVNTVDKVVNENRICN